MNPEQLFTRLRAILGTFSASQLITLGLTFLLVVGIVTGSTWWVQRPTYALLFSGMEPESAGEVVTRLKSMKVPYQLDEGGGGIRVPADRVDELRLEFTSQGLPSSGRIGFEIFDRTAFGVTEFIEHVNYRRALEGEIARTITTIREVSGARVHIAMGKDSLFGEPRPAKASVVLKLKGQKAIASSTVTGIANLIASSVEGLRPEAVVVLDSFGRPLSRPRADEDDPLGAAQLERQQQMERDLSQRVVALLEPVVGPDRVRVNVAVKLNPMTREQTEERWDPESPVVRNKQSSNESGPAVPATPVAVVAGARSNQAPPPDPPQGGAPAAQSASAAFAPGPSRSSESASYEVSRTFTKTLQPPGDVDRLSVAVIVDDAIVSKKGQDGAVTTSRKPRSRDELQKVQGIVAAAVGLDTERGDQITVEHMSFDEPPQEEIVPPTLLEKYGSQASEAGRYGIVLGIIAAAFLLVVRPLMQRVTVTGPHVMAGGVPVAMGGAPTVLPPGHAGATGSHGPSVADIESQIEAQLDAEAGSPDVDALRVPVLTRRVAQMSQKEPETVARLLRTWMRDTQRS